MSQGYSLYVIMKRYSFYTQIKKKLKQPLQRMKKKLHNFFSLKMRKKIKLRFHQRPAKTNTHKENLLILFANQQFAL